MIQSVHLNIFQRLRLATCQRWAKDSKEVANKGPTFIYFCGLSNISKQQLVLFQSKKLHKTNKNCYFLRGSPGKRDNIKSPIWYWEERQYQPSKRSNEISCVFLAFKLTSHFLPNFRVSQVRLKFIRYLAASINQRSRSYFG